MPARNTTVAIQDESFLLDGRPTYAGRCFRHGGRDLKIEGLLLNSRMVQGIFDDENPETRDRWRYPDTGFWDAERNIREFLAAMPLWRSHGLLCFTINLQGGCPVGYISGGQPWQSSAFRADGSLKPAYLDRLARILDRADELGMVAIVGLYYFGQDEALRDEAAVRRGVDEAVAWLLDERYGNVLLEVNNECDVPRYEHEVLQPQRVHELIDQAKGLTYDGRRLLVGTSFKGGSVPTENVVAASDFLLVHGNGVREPARIREMVARTRSLPTYRPMPIVFNEDDHFDFELPENNCLAALESYASWGYYDPGPGAGGNPAYGDYVEGYQNVPVNWGINTPRKRAFFDLVRAVAGA
jgi:hypothetical protein